MEDNKNKVSIPKRCPKCGGKAFYRKPSTGPWRCHFCDPPPIVKRQQE